MNEKKKSNWLLRIFTGLALLASNLIVGAALGLLWVRLFVDIDMGLGGVADTLGGIMVGALLALVIGVVMVFFLSVRLQWVWICIVVVIAGLTFAGLALTAQPIAKKKFQPPFAVKLKISYTQEVLATVPPGERPFPFVEAGVWTGKPELIQVNWGPGFERCVATPSDTDLEALLPLVQEAIAATVPNCRTPEDDLSLSIDWNLAGDSDLQWLDAGCLPDQPELVALTNAIGALADRLCGAEAGSNRNN